MGLYGFKSEAARRDKEQNNNSRIEIGRVMEQHLPLRNTLALCSSAGVLDSTSEATALMMAQSRERSSTVV